MRRPVQLAPPAPNPSRGAVRLRFEAFEPGVIQVRIVDAAGRVVRRAEVAGRPGALTWTWDGSDDRGRRASAGHYRVRVWSRSGGTSRPLVLLP